jgi:hypothetical protein
MLGGAPAARGEAPLARAAFPVPLRCARMNDLALLLLLLFIVVLMFRGKKSLPALGAALGRGVKDAREAVSRELGDDKDDDQSASK